MAVCTNAVPLQYPLPATVLAARAGPPLGADLEVPEFGGDSVGAPVELTVDEQTDADAGADRDEHGVLIT